MNYSAHISRRECMRDMCVQSSFQKHPRQIISGSGLIISELGITPVGLMSHNISFATYIPQNHAAAHAVFCVCAQTLLFVRVLLSY